MLYELSFVFFFFCKQKTAYEMRISDWSSDVCSSDLFRKRGRNVWLFKKKTDFAKRVDRTRLDGDVCIDVEDLVFGDPADLALVDNPATGRDEPSSIRYPEHDFHHGTANDPGRGVDTVKEEDPEDPTVGKQGAWPLPAQ